MDWWSELCHKLEPELEGLQVGVYASGGAPYHHLALAALWGASPRPIRAEDIKEGALDNLDALIFPGGGFTAMTGMLEPLGIDGATKVRHWVSQGGMYLGSCAGSFLPASVGDAYWEAHQEAKALHMTSACLANSSDSIFEGLTSPGVGALEARISDRHHWLAKGLPETFEIIHYNGPLFDLSGTGEFAKPDGVLQPIRATERFTPSEGFMGENPAETLLERCIEQGAFNAVVSDFGDGKVVLFGSHPEFGFDAIQLGWRKAVMLLGNALSFQSSRRKSTFSQPYEKHDARQVLKESAATFERIASTFETLNKANVNDWLEGRVPSFLGLNANDLWHTATHRAAEVAKSSEALCLGLQERNPEHVNVWLDDVPQPNQDVGFMGLVQLLDEIEKQLNLTQKQLDKNPVVLKHAYDGFGVHPYQIAASSYLSAAGLTAAAYLLTVTIAKLSQNDDLIPLDFLLA